MEFIPVLIESLLVSFHKHGKKLKLLLANIFLFSFPCYSEKQGQARYPGIIVD